MNWEKAIMTKTQIVGELMHRNNMLVNCNFLGRVNNSV